MAQKSNETIGEIPRFQKYCLAISVCNNLAMLASQCTMVVFFQRLSVLKDIESCWAKSFKPRPVLPEDGETHSESELDNFIRPRNEGASIKLDTGLSDLGFRNVTDENDDSSDDTIVDEKLQSDCTELIEREDQGVIETVIFDNKLVTTKMNVTAIREDSQSDEEEEVTEMEESFHVNNGKDLMADDAELPYRFLCLSCKDVFETFAELKEHKSKVHDPSTPSKSLHSPANNVVARETNAVAKKRSARERDKCHTCSVCNRTYTFSYELRNHMTTHTGERPFMCPACGLLFKSRSALRSHSFTHGSAKPYSCKLCDATFLQPYSLVCHVRAVHTGERPYGCDVCDQRFVTSTLLRFHTYLHTGERPYSCSECGRTFRKPGPLREHAKMHSQVKGYKCDVCDESFRRSSTLGRHKKVHLGLRPHGCNRCGKTFSSASNMRIHLRTHTGQKLYACKSCGKAFAHQQTLKKHSEIHEK